MLLVYIWDVDEVDSVYSSSQVIQTFEPTQTFKQTEPFCFNEAIDYGHRTNKQQLVFNAQVK